MLITKEVSSRGHDCYGLVGKLYHLSHIAYVRKLPPRGSQVSRLEREECYLVHQRTGPLRELHKLICCFIHILVFFQERGKGCKWHTSLVCETQCSTVQNCHGRRLQCIYVYAQPFSEAFSVIDVLIQRAGFDADDLKEVLGDDCMGGDLVVVHLAFEENVLLVVPGRKLLEAQFKVADLRTVVLWLEDTILGIFQHVLGWEDV